jgi:hypothetical protein
MAQTNDRYRILLTWSVLDVEARRTALTQVLHEQLVHSNQLCMIATGWAHDDLVPATLIAAARGERLVSIEKSDVLNLTIP